jgi:hypothetical protein
MCKATDLFFVLSRLDTYNPSKKSQMEARYREARNQVEMYYFVSEYDIYSNNCITYVKKNFVRS